MLTKYDSLKKLGVTYKKFSVFCVNKDKFEFLYRSIICTSKLAFVTADSVVKLYTDECMTQHLEFGDCSHNSYYINLQLCSAGDLMILQA